MFWLRFFLFALPVGLAFPATWLFQAVRRLDYSRSDSDLVCVIREPIKMLNPLVPLTGPTREVTDLLFEPILIRDDDLKLRPNLMTQWSYLTVVTIRCAGEAEAKKVVAKLRAWEPTGDGALEIKEAVVKGPVVVVSLKGFEAQLLDSLLELIPKESLGQFLQVRLSLKNSVRDSFETFLRSSVEKTQIRMLDYQGDRVANIFLQKGDTDLFLKELRLYYESNRNLEPAIEIVGDSCYTSSHEMVIQFRNDVRWHDGVLFSTDDVIYSYNEMTRPGSMLPLAESFRFVDRLEKMDQRSIRVVCRGTPAIMLESWEKLPVLPAHILESTRSQAEWLQFFEKPVGNGPYKLDSRLDDGGVVLVSNEAYFRTAPRQKRVIYRTLPDRESRLRAIRFGEIDALVPDDRDLAWSKRNPGYLRSLRCLPKFQDFIVWNLQNPALGKPEIRNALARSIDLTAVLESSATRFQRPTDSLFFPGAPYCTEAMPLPDYDIQAAAKLFARAGYKRDEKTARILDEHRKPLRFKLSVNRLNPTQMHLARAVCEQWNKAGIECQLEPLDWSEILSNRLANRKFEAVLLGWELPFERDRYTTWHSSEAGPRGGNFCGLRNQVVDELLEEIRSERALEKVKLSTARLQKEIGDLQPCFFLCDTGRIITLRRKAIEVVREGLDGQIKAEPVNIGKSGVERVRPWWVRKGTDPDLTLER